MSVQLDTDQSSSWKKRTRQWRAWCWKKLQSNSIAIEIFLFIGMLALLVGLLITLGIHLKPAPHTCKDYGWVCNFFGTEDKKEIMRLLSWVTVFIASMFGLWTANRRAKAMEDSAQAQVYAAKAQVQTANATKSGNLQQRFKDAIENLGSISESMCISGAHALFHIALEEESLRDSIADILCMHIRTKTQSREYQQCHPEGPSIEIQSLMNLLFAERTHGSAQSRAEQVRKFWRGLQADLSEGCFNGIILNHAQFRDAYLLDAKFLGACLPGAQFQSSNLSIAQLQMAHLPSACFRGANLIDTKFWDANLGDAQFQAAYLDGTHFQGADLESVQFQGCFCVDKVLVMEHFGTRINGRKGKNAGLSKVIFSDGVDSEDLERVVGKLTPLKTIKMRKKRSAEVVNDFKRKMSRHDGPPDHTVPMGLRANVGAYTEEDARRWIEEYEKLRAIDQTS